MTALMDLIKGRRSVRTFDGNAIRQEDREKLEGFINADIFNPFGIPVEFVLLDAGELGLSSPVIAGEKLYVAGKVAKEPYADVAFGYSFERLVLFAWSLGIGTTWIGGTMKRELFEKAAGLKAGEMMPCVSPLGYPAAKKTFREMMMRKGVGADNRMSAEKLFFDGCFDKPLAGVQQDVADLTGDLQKIDVGIALCHFVMGLEEQGKSAEVAVSDPGITVPDGVEYIASVRIN